MDMVCHAAEGMNTATKLHGYFLHEQVKAITIGIVNEYRLACVAAKNYMIESAGEMYAWFTCHGESIVDNV
jgi:hypothetical protein